MPSEVPDFDAWFPEIDGFPRPNWEAIGDWIESHSTEDHWQTAWQEIARTWLGKLSERLGGGYVTVESDHFHLLSELDRKHQQDLLNFLEQTRVRMLHALADIPQSKSYGKQVVLRFTIEDDFYRYISYFDPEGDFARIGGRFINRGYMHIAYYHHDSLGFDRKVLVHELTHNVLESLPLPIWLSEALAMLFEQDLAGGRSQQLTRELAERHRVYWNARTIQEFWRGDSFSNPDAQDLAYALARILLDFIVTDLQPTPADFRDFVLHANYKDAGEAAARNFLGTELSDLASAFLGPGEWAPRFA